MNCGHIIFLPDENQYECSIYGTCIGSDCFYNHNHGLVNLMNDLKDQLRSKEPVKNVGAIAPWLNDDDCNLPF